MCEEDDSAPLIDWLDTLPVKALAKCRVRIERMKELGHELRRPEADLLREGIYELRVGLRGLNYRLLYFLHGDVAAVLSSGVIKERPVPKKEIDRALKRKARFVANPKRHTYKEP